MYQLFKQAGLRKFLLIESIPFAISMLVTESFFKLGSFTLECLAFLSGWYFLGWIASSLLQRNAEKRG